jgi:hypothetical protein
MKKSLLGLSLRISREKLPLHPEIKHFLHYSFIIQNNKIVEWATNNRHHHPIHYGYNKNNTDPDFVPKGHSEINAYKRARGLLDKDKPFDIINIRLSKKKEIRLSKPCVGCFDLLKELGCRRFYYSSPIGFLSC